MAVKHTEDPTTRENQEYWPIGKQDPITQGESEGEFDTPNQN